MDLNTYLLIWVCIFGLCLGSFYNVVILRSLSGESVVFPPSKCPKCGKKLLWWHNIPVLSYILLGGKCYYCKQKISVQYPIIEIITMLLFALSFIKFGISCVTLFVIFWLSCFLIMTVTDIREKLVDCNIAIASGIGGVIFAWISGGVHGILHSILGIIAGVLIMELIARSGFLIAGTRAMGEADTYVAGAIGAICGIFGIIKLLLISLFASMVFVVPVFLYNRYKANDKATCIFAILFTMSVLLFRTVSNYLTLGLLAIIGFCLVYFILKDMKTETNRNYLPYVPALASSLLYYVFYIM